MSYIQYLNTFTAVYRCGSVSAAADVLNITQPTISAQLRALETKLGKKLFTRKAHGVAATPDAHELANAIGPSLDRIDAVIRGMLAPRTRLKGTITLGGPVEFIHAMLLPQMKTLPDAGVRFRFTFGLTAELLELLRHDKLDMVIATGPHKHKTIESAPLYHEDFILVAKPGFVSGMAADKADVFSMLEQYPVLAYAENLPILRRYCKTVLGADPHFKAAMVIPDLRALLSAVESGLGISVLPHYLCQASLAAGKIAALFTPRQPPANTLYLAWNIQSGRMPLKMHVRDTLLPLFHPTLVDAS